MNETPPAMPPHLDYQIPEPPKGMGTGAKWGVGCSIGCLILLLLGGIGAYVAFVKMKEFGNKMLDQFTSPTPVVFVDPAADPATISAVTTRFDAFRDALTNGGEATPLELSGEDINLLIHHHPDWKDLAGKAQVAIADNRLTGEISVPLGDLGSWMKGRYFNGKATIRLALVNGSLEAYLDDLEFGGKPLPPEVKTALGAENIFKNSQTDPELQKLIQNLREIRIEGGRLIIVPKPAAERQPPVASPSPGK